MADSKGKAIRADEDEPFQLEDEDTATVMTEFRMSLIGKILNPKKQNVERLIQYMPKQWDMQDRITANDLGNGKFLFNFLTEEDIKTVLSQGPFHYNYCMFVLVRWEPIVHDDYPWVILFWVRLTGMPLHFWTVKNLRGLGGRLGRVDTLELEEGRMLIDIDTRKALKFKTMAVSPQGEEVTIQIAYDLLFKHCTSCGYLTHEKEYCPLKDVARTQSNTGRSGVFARIKVPDGNADSQSWLKEQKLDDNCSDALGSVAVGRQLSAGESYARKAVGYDKPIFSSRNRHAYSRDAKLDRVTRNKAEWRSTRHRSSPYARHPESYWREKQKHTSPSSRPAISESGKGVPYERRSSNPRDEDLQTSSHQNSKLQSDGDRRTRRADEHVHSKESEGQDLQRSKKIASTIVSPLIIPIEGETLEPIDQSQQITHRSFKHNNTELTSNDRSKMRLGSTIVSPLRSSHAMEFNVTKRTKGVTRALTYSPNSLQVDINGLEGDQMIGALNDMEAMMDMDEEKLEYCDQDDDLLGEELLALQEEERQGEESRAYLGSSRGSSRKDKTKPSRERNRSNAPLGTKSKKTVFLRRGSPRHFAASSSGTRDAEKKTAKKDGQGRQHGQRRSSQHGQLSAGLMGSKNPSKQYP